MKRRWFVVLLAVVGSSLFAGNALANHLPAVPNTTIILGRGTLAADAKYNLDGIKVQTKNPVDIVSAEVHFIPGASAGWHFHPGPVFVVVKQGTLSVWDESCTKNTYSAGSTFFEAGRASSLLVKNESTTTEAIVYGTFIVPVGATPLRIGSEHLCGVAE